VETWTREVREEGVFVTVPKEAQQALIFLAPETGGDFSTLRRRARPPRRLCPRRAGSASGQLGPHAPGCLSGRGQGKPPRPTPKLLKERAEMAARSLGVRLDQQCFDKPSDQQAPCLVQHTDGLVLDDTNAQSRVAQLTSGSAVDLMNQLSYSRMWAGRRLQRVCRRHRGYGQIFASLHTAHFQYIPALALPAKDTLNLRLNVPPSFRDPKSVVVVALPPVGAVKPPPLHPVNPAESLLRPETWSGAASRGRAAGLCHPACLRACAAHRHQSWSG
jgi:hypothetical protein